MEKALPQLYTRGIPPQPQSTLGLLCGQVPEVLDFGQGRGNMGPQVEVPVVGMVFM